MEYHTAIARLKSVETSPRPTDRSDKIPVSSFLSVPHTRLLGGDRASHRSSVGFVSPSTAGFQKSPIAHTARAALVAMCDRVGQATVSEPPRSLSVSERASIARLCRMEYGSTGSRGGRYIDGV